METSSWILGCFTALIALLLAVYVSFALREKGPILSNTYLFLNKAQRENADRKAEYKRVSIIFGYLSAAFVCLTIRVFTHERWAMVLFFAIVLFVIFYAFFDAIKTCLKK